MRRLRPPRVRPCVSVDAAVGGAVPLRFRGERLPCPTRVRACLCMTRIHGPVQRQLHLIKHRAPKPARAIFFFPEQGMRNAMSGLPVPVIVVPESTRLIAATHDGLELLPLCHLVLLNLHPSNFPRLPFIFIVPP